MRQTANLTAWALNVAQKELMSALPRRWMHSLGVAKRAALLASITGDDFDLLCAAALLHDVGYAPRLAHTGFHALDGARFLRDEHGSDARLMKLVANHSFALLEAEERGLRSDLESEFPQSSTESLTDALVWCDMTTTPDGEPTTTAERIAEICQRYGTHSLIGRFISRASPEIHKAARRIDEALATHPR